MYMEIDFAKWEVQLRKGSLGLAVLATLWHGKLYGLEILRRLEEVAGYAIPEGTIYPLLNRLKAAAYLESEWVEGLAGHPRKYYQLTATGRRYVRGIAHTWGEFASGMDRLLAPLEEKSRAKRRAV